jgi:2-O-(6-phospho-alpha-D-mannosyl)-D-glycerate hydrolase
VLHGAGTTRPVLIQAGAMPEAGFVAVALRRGASPPGGASAGRAPGLAPGIVAGSLSAIAEPDGTVLIADERLGLSVRANQLVDDGDRGDLYHFDRAGDAVRPRAARASIVEAGPLRARLRIEQEIDLPVGLSLDRGGRSATTHAATLTTEVTLIAGERRVELTTSFDNPACDHRLRALVRFPFSAERLDVEHGLAVVARPLDPGDALGAGKEHAAKTGQHHGFVDVSDGASGVALLSRGLPEHELLREPGSPGGALALTLVRSVGWLSRGDLSVIDHAAGPMVATPGAQELGPHRFEYALVLHAGDWRAGGVGAEARRYAAPAVAVTPKGRAIVPAGRSLVAVTPSDVIVTALHPAENGRGTIVRVLNASPSAAQATLEPAFPVREATEVDPLESPLARSALVVLGGAVRLELAPWQLATVRLG